MVNTLNKKQVICFLLIISLISLGFKLYTIDFSTPVYSDNLSYTLDAIAHANGDFSQRSDRGIGWSLFAFPFFSLIDSDKIIDYSNTIRILSLIVSSSTIIPVYLLGRKFFDERYSLVVASLFAFEPHLNYNAGFGLSEPFFHLAMIGAFYFVLTKDSKFIIPSLILASLTWWIRFNGITVLIIISIIYFLTLRGCPNKIRNYCIGLVLFLIIISPMLYERDQQFGDPLFFAYSQTIFAGSWDKTLSVEFKETNLTASDYIENNGLFSFLQTFVFNGVYNIFSTLWTISFPYLFILIPFGIIFSLRAFDQNKRFIQANWLFIILSLATLVLTFSLIPDKRYLFFVLPFLIIFCTIPIQRVVQYGLNTFTFNQRKKDIFLISVIIVVIILSGLFTMRYGVPDVELENEKIEFSKYAIKNFNGNILREYGHSLDYLMLQLIDNPEGNFKNCNVEFNKKLCGIDQREIPRKITISGNSLDEIISKGESYNLKYIISNKMNYGYQDFINEIYDGENTYTYLNKIFDSEQYGFKKLNVKVFEIDYEQFHSP